MKKNNLILLLLLYSSVICAAKLNVRIYTTINITAVQVSILSGKYAVYHDTSKITDLYQSMMIEISVEPNNKIKLKKNGIDVGIYDNINLVGNGFINTMTIKIIGPIKRERVYDDDLKVSAIGEFLEIINYVELEHYIAGVVEAEGDGKYSIEFFKLQSIICRTYAINNIRKHCKESVFNLCDDVHCQVYKGHCKSKIITTATSQTAEMIIVDKNSKPISAAFHSNCGGQTMNAEDVWSIPTSYLKSRIDTFCLKKPNATWQVKIPKKKWLDTLSIKYLYPCKNINDITNALTFLQSDRKINFYDNPVIPLKSIRNEFKLKSTFFSLSCLNDTIILNGRGFGHGVGLCQEGAIRMVELGYDYLSIIQFYYRDVKVIRYKNICLY